MSTTIQSMARSRRANATHHLATDRLRQSFAACRVRFKWLGTSKTLSPEQKDQAAESFDAEGEFLSAGKKLINTRDPVYRDLVAIRTQIRKFWKDSSLPFPEPGVRLIRQDRIDSFNEELTDFRTRLDAAVRNLENEFPELKLQARERLGSLYCDTDYPDSLDGQFAVDWDYPSIDVPEYLRRANPELYEEQSRRVAQRFDQAVQMAEQAFLEELDRLVNHLAERLSGSDDGKPKVFRDTAVENLGEFFRRFRELNIGSSQQLDELVDRCERVVRGIEPRQLRDNESLRQSVSTQLAAMQSNLDQMLIDRPRRNILRPSQPRPGDRQ